MDYLGMVSDRGVLSWLYSHAQETPSLQRFLSNTLHQLSMPSLNIYTSVIASTSTSSVLDAMRLMSEQGVSSIAVLDEETGTLLSAVSVTDIGKVSRSSMT
jgi:CBS domain-containing protein